MTRVGAATDGLAEARFVRARRGAPITFPPHTSELVFGFVLEGSALLDFRDGFALGPADSFVIPPGEAWSLREASSDFRLLHVTTARLEIASNSPL